jgi:hypothetical protein
MGDRADEIVSPALAASGSEKGCTPLKDARGHFQGPFGMRLHDVDHLEDVPELPGILMEDQLEKGPGRQNRGESRHHVTRILLLAVRKNFLDESFDGVLQGIDCRRCEKRVEPVADLLVKWFVVFKRNEPNDVEVELHRYRALAADKPVLVHPGRLDFVIASDQPEAGPFR